MRACLILAAAHLVAAPLAAQASARVDTIAEARRLRDANDFAGAAALMRPYVGSHPDDAGSARFAALMAYWAKQPSSDSLYAKALAGHPQDADVRLEYGRFLVETGRVARARVVLAPLVATDSARITAEQVAGARTLLGTLDYWRGDYTKARDEFRAALVLDRNATDARRQLTEIEGAASAWVRFASDVWDDDQPLRFATFEADGGWFIDPLTPLGVRARSVLFDVDGVSESTLSAEVSFASYLAAAHLDVSGAGGVLERSFGESTDWTGRLTLGARLPRTFVLGATYGRTPYTNTIRSLARAIMVQTVEGSARWGTARGWMGALVARREIYPDDNHVSTGFGWLLAPLSSREAATFHVGYAFTAQSAERSRFNPRGDIDVPPGQALAAVLGEYNPYYTPRNLRVHSALANTRLAPDRRWTVDASARYGVSAHDNAPVLVAVATPPSTVVTRGFYDRSFHPWNAHGSVDWSATPAMRIGLGVEHGREAYYAFTSGRVQLTYTFVAAAAKRADLR